VDYVRDRLAADQARRDLPLSHAPAAPAGQAAPGEPRDREPKARAGMA
jgi:hypothetical protein